MIGDAVTDAFRLSLLRTERALRMAADSVTDRLYGPMSRRLESTTGRMLDTELNSGVRTEGSAAYKLAEKWKSAGSGGVLNTAPELLLGRGRIVPELGEAVSELVEKSPTFRSGIQEIRRAGWSIEYGPAGKGSFALRDEQKIVIDGRYRKQPTVERLRPLAEEVGHALNKNPPRELPYRGDDPMDWVEKNVAEQLTDEGEAKLFGVQVFWEIERNGGPYIRVGGRRYSEYEAVYERMTRGEISRDEARREIGGMHDMGEIGSGTTQTYGDYWRSHFLSRYLQTYNATRGAVAGGDLAAE